MNPKIQPQVQFELCSLLFVKNDKDDKKTDNISINGSALNEDMNANSGNSTSTFSTVNSSYWTHTSQNNA